MCHQLRTKMYFVLLIFILRFLYVILLNFFLRLYSTTQTLTAHAHVPYECKYTNSASTCIFYYPSQWYWILPTTKDTKCSLANLQKKTVEHWSVHYKFLILFNKENWKVYQFDDDALIFMANFSRKKMDILTPC